MYEMTDKKMWDIKVKPIPKYILKLIKKADDLQDTHNGIPRYYAYLTKMEKQLTKVTVAVRNYHKQWVYKQCAVHFIYYNKCLVKDMCFTYCAGYKVGWYEQGIGQYRKWYESLEWGSAEDKWFDVYAPIVNIDYLKKFAEYKYSAFELFNSNKVLQYLRLYREYPQIEYLVKLGFNSIATSKMILKQICKDKKFISWLLQNKEEITNNHYYNDVILRAYKKNQSLSQLQREKKLTLKLSHDDNVKGLRQYVSISQLKTIINYIASKNISIALYKDYFDACIYLGLNMNLDKNLLPHDFKRWHDIRIDEYHSKKAEKDKQERKELYNKFEKVAQKYISLQRQLTKDDYVCLIALSPNQLVYEGEQLHHCVGRMNYDQKFIREETLIFFVRNRLAQNTPFVTLEYSLSKKKILQCYGEHDSKPNDSVLEFVNKKWLPYANRKLKQLKVA